MAAQEVATLLVAPQAALQMVWVGAGVVEVQAEGALAALVVLVGEEGVGLHAMRLLRDIARTHQIHLSCRKGTRMEALAGNHCCTRA